MARKEKFTKEDILRKSVLYVREFGIDNLTVRDISKFIGCSTQPIFKFYNNMNDFKIDLKEYLYNDYKIFISNYVDKDDYLMTISYAYAMYGKMESNIFKALFVTELAGSRTTIDVINTKRNKETIMAMVKQYNISLEKAEKVYLDVRFYTHGIASQLCCGSIILSDDEIYRLISNMINLRLKK